MSTFANRFELRCEPKRSKATDAIVLQNLPLFNEDADFQKLFFYFAERYMLFSQMQVKPLNLKLKRIFFKMEYDIFKHENSGIDQNFVFYSENKKSD